jgi:hypothetical protein
MITIKQINVINALSLDYLLVQFRVEDTVEDLSNYKFDILRSTSPSSGYEVIVSDLDKFEYIDTGVNLYKPSIRYYYKIKVKDLKEGREQLSDIFGEMRSCSPDNYAMAIITNYDIFLKNVAGNPPIKILIKKKFGQHCTNCWDDIRMQPRIDNCNVCFGTGYTGGYFDPIEVNYSSMTGEAGMEQILDLSDDGEGEQPIQIWILNYPIVSPGDIIVDRYNRRYNIQAVKPTSKNQYILRQVLTIYRLPASHIVYKFPVEV